MHLTPIKPPTKAQIEASNQHKQQRAIQQDIFKINEAIKNCDYLQMIELHRYLDGKYQYCVADWGKSMYGYADDFGFDYDVLGVDALKDNLSMMIPKLEAFMHGWNVKNHSTKPAIANTSPSDVNVTINNNVTVNITFEQARSQIEDMTSLTDSETEEILAKIDELETIINGQDKKKTKWENAKSVLVWLADKSFDVGMTLLPLLLKIQ